MPTAFLRAFGQLFDPRILRLLAASLLLSALCFVAVWAGVAWLLASTEPFGLSWLDNALRVLGGLATLVLTWFLFPLLASAFVGLFLDRVAVAVEARHYPHLPRAPGLPWWRALGCSLRFLGTVLVLNVLLLLLWFVPPAYPVGYVAVNGLLLGREYFELVALRRLDPAGARRLRRANAIGVFAVGAAGAFLLTLPFVNFVAPVLLTAAMVHRVEAWRSQAAGGG